MSNTEGFWSGEFGDDYHKRNRVDYRDRLPFWQSAVQYTEPRSVLEIGCGPGWNLLALREVQPTLDLYGIEINEGAVAEARSNNLKVDHGTFDTAKAMYEPGAVDLVFTSGVLIHVAPDDLDRCMNAMIEISGRYVMAIEYDADREVPRVYRGHDDKLWARPYGKLLEKKGLKLLSEGMAGGWESATYYLLEKAQT
jgi:pseudaminic acid biosynthesis-associated methylase